MAWHEQGPSGNYFICLRVGEKRFRRSLKTNCKDDADGDLARVEDNLRQVERGWLTIPMEADVVSFLLSNGRVTVPLKIEQLTLKELFEKYFNSLPVGSLEESTVYTMKVHRKSLEAHFGKSKIVDSIDLKALQEYITKRSKDIRHAATPHGAYFLRSLSIASPESIHSSEKPHFPQRNRVTFTGDLNNPNGTLLPEPYAPICPGIWIKSELSHFGHLPVCFI